MKSGSMPVKEFDGSVDWGAWANEDRTVAQQQALSPEQRAEIKRVGRCEGRVDDIYPELDTTIAGPWMTRWSPIVHHNRHTKGVEGVQ